MEFPTSSATSSTTSAIQHIGEQSAVEECNSFIGVISSNGGEGSSIPLHIRSFSPHKIRLAYWNGKPVDVRYLFNVARRQKSRVLLLETESLSLVMGKRETPELNKWSTISELCDYIMTNVDLHECLRRSSCRENHFHHGYPQDIVMWLRDRVKPAIVSKEFNKQFENSIHFELAAYPSDGTHYRTTDKRVESFMQYCYDCL
ncbi:repeat element protein-c11.1 [Ichnoviriform fugitivi]|uniref:Repeat element protein-c11.1 n=1 Tax=Ichnoviriform fugitivi TaxID=265522 RepID=A2Q0H6_9VIRU|nr:repeat element protein-c11.1 [Ichnoviriform fugitivi]BAF45691.1 repeat element protein-c11.1 [Ichnoviriform fugitivi]